MTTGVDIFVGTAKNDTFTAAAGTLNDGDVLTDPSTSDNDTLNAVFNSTQIALVAGTGLTPTISGVENININIDAFSGVTGAGNGDTFDATNVSGSTITLSSTKAGFDGEAGVLAAGSNSVTAGTGIKDLTVAALSTGKVNTGTAKTVAVGVDGTKSSTANLTVNGDVTSLVTSAAGGTLKTVNITATEESVLTTKATSNLFGTTAATFNLDGDITLKGTGAELTGIIAKNVGTGTLKAEISDTATAANLSKAEISEVIVADGYNATLTLLEGASVTAKGTLGAAVGITNGAEFAAQTEGSELTINLAGATIGTTTATITDFANTTINITQDVTVGAITGTKTKLTGDMSVAFVGAGDVTATAAAVNISTLDASAIDGDLTYATVTGNKITVKGGAGANQITAADTAEVTYVGQNGGDTITSNTNTGILSVETGSGKDTLNITSLTTGKILANLGAGNDLVVIDGAAALAPTGTLILDGGAGSDTLRLASDTTATLDLKGAALGSSVTGFETLQLFDTNASAAVQTYTLGSYVVSGNAMSVESYTGTTTAPVAANYTIHVNDGATSTTASTVDLSKLTFSALKPIKAINVTTGTEADTVIGANLSSGMTSTIDTNAGDDTVIVGSGAGITTVNIEAGANTIDLSNATAANELYFASTASGTTIDGWKAVTKFDFQGVTGGTAKTESITAANKGVWTDQEVYFINTTGAAANFTLEGTAVVTDFTSANQISAYLNEHFDTSTVAAGNDNIFIFNDTNLGVNKSYIYEYTEAATANGTIDAAELTLLGTVNNGGTALNTSNYDDSIA